jgi:hypothetical protein
MMFLCAGPTWVLAQRPPAPIPDTTAPATPPEKPQVEKLDENRYRIGKIVIDRKTREISFPAKVNMAEGLLEFLMVMPKGKVHESLLVTDISPTHLNFALLILRYKPSIELFALLDEGHPTGLYPNVPAEIKAAARIGIDVEWKDGDGKTHRNPISEWIQQRENDTAMPAGPWLYTGSGMSQGKYIPDLSGDIAAIYVAQSALINYPGENDEDDTVWFAYPNRVPAKDTEVSVIISPYPKP